MTMKIGGLYISSMEFNGKSVESVWWGNDLVWGGAPSDIMLDYFTLPKTTENFIVTDGELDFIPYINDMKYTGSAITLQASDIHGYVPDFMTISGTMEATDIGTYYVTISLPTGYKFTSNNSSSITVSWKIVQAYTVTINVRNSYANGNYYTKVVIDDVEYAGNSTYTLSLAEGTSIRCQTLGSSSSFTSTYITYNGTTVATGSSSAAARYLFDVDSDVTIDGYMSYTSIYFGYPYGYMTITTT